MDVKTFGSPAAYTFFSITFPDSEEGGIDLCADYILGDGIVINTDFECCDERLGKTKMSIEFFILNYHISFLFFIFWIGLGLVIFGQFKTVERRRKMITFSPFDLKNYNKSEIKIIFAGFFLIIMGVFGLVFVVENYGYTAIVYDVNGEKTTEYIKPGSY